MFLLDKLPGEIFSKFETCKKSEFSLIGLGEASSLIIGLE